jgi:hypothetical protein
MADDDIDPDDRRLVNRIRKVETYFYKRQSLDLVIVMALVVLGTLWSTVIIAFIQQVIFRGNEPHYVWWFLIALLSTVVLMMVLRALDAPLFLFA